MSHWKFSQSSANFAFLFFVFTGPTASLCSVKCCLLSSVFYKTLLRRQHLSEHKEAVGPVNTRNKKAKLAAL